MKSQRNHSVSLALGLAITVLTLAGALPASADDTEIFIGATTSGVKPNILFVLDTSGSMETEVVTENAPYDPSVTYAGSCNSSYVYWVRDTGWPFYPPTCATTNYFNLSALTCKPALTALAAGGAGLYAANRAAQYDTTDTRWEQIRDYEKSKYVECRADRGIHGQTDAASAKYATDSSNIRWTTSSTAQITWSANNTDRSYVFYSANYLNWWNNPVNVQVQTRLEIVKGVMTELLSTLSGVNVGLMRYSSNRDADVILGNGCFDQRAEGGMVTFAMADIDAGTNRADLLNIIAGYNADGCTPLSETLYEALQYMQGGNVFFGNDSRVSPDPGDEFPSVPESRQAADTNMYESPMDISCQKNFIVYLTDGLPTADESADDEIIALPDFSTTVAADCDGTGYGRCLDDLAEYMYETDLQPTMPGNQNVPSYWIGFGPEVTGSALLQTAANRGGGQFYSADNTVGLAAVLTSIVNEILTTNTTFTAPSVSVNAFNRTQTLADLYVSVFRPEIAYRWPGNVKKYMVTDGEIVDADGNPAVDPNTGFFADGARSIWSGSADGAEVQEGGAAKRQPIDPATRNVYTNIDSTTSDLTATTNRLLVTNLLISDSVLGVGAVGQPARADLIEWARGRDVQDEDLDLDVVEARQDMGDPLHAKPAVVIYGGTQSSPDITDAVVYSPTNDGMLHAIDAETGDELWSFMPQDVLDNILPLYLSTATSSKHYALDADVRALKYDVDQNGIVEPGDGDRVILYFGQRRGGGNYFAVEVTDRDQPEHLFTIGATQLANLGQTWSTPAITRVDISGASQNSQKLVLIFAGGYDDTQDGYTYKTDSVGNGIYMVDALTGALLWRASRTGANLNLAALRHSIPSNVAVFDLNNDTYADRMYVGDMGGLVFRFDIYSGNAVSSLVTGGVIANLGAYSYTAPQPLAVSRRLYNTPDVALMKRRGKSTFFNIALGSGYRGHPLDDRTEDRFYAIRDYLPFTKLTQAQYDALTPITDADLVDITDDPTPTLADDVPGWRLELRLPSGWVGEKVLAESRTFNNNIFFPTYLPNEAAAANQCTPAAGRNRVYVISAHDGAPVIEQDGVISDSDNDGDNDLTVEDRYSDLAQSGIAPETVMLFPGGGAGEDPVVCLNGAEVLEACTNFNSRIKTFWHETGAN
jgi:type IV pilus assembly protein PilY1